VRKLGLLILMGNVVWFGACGGNGGTASSTVTGVSVSCSPSTITSGQMSQCLATVSGTGNFNPAVEWGASAGTISTSGTFTAPVVSSQTSVTITADSVQFGNISGTATVTVNPTTSAGNVAPLVVDAGPDGQEVNIAYTTVTVCVPGTQQCQTIDHVQVDTGSEGLRLLSSVLTIPLPPENISGQSLDECLVFADGFVWGPVATADVTIAGETASAVPVHMLIPSTTAPPVPSSCSSQTSGGNEGGSASTLGANGIIGVGPFQQDCGLACTSLNSQIPDVYYTCSGSNCNPTFVPLAGQVPNPVIAFNTDDNGVLIQLPSVPNGGSPGANGSLIFGINTQSNNNLSLAANTYTIPDGNGSTNNIGDFITTFNGHTYPQSFIDSGSNGLFFLDSNTTGIPTCPGQNSGWYCPNNSPDNLSASNQGQDNNGNPAGNNVPVNFTIENANNLFTNNDTAYSTLSGPFSGAFDWGLPFFYGKNVFTGIDGLTTPNGPTGPYFAY